MMRLFWEIALVLLLLTIVRPADGQIISADRPGVGSDADVVPLYTLQPEIGTDTKEIRFGIADNTEVDRDDTSWGIKYSLISNNHYKLSAKAIYDKDLKAGVELPAQFIPSKYFYFGTDVILFKHSKTYVGEFNITPNERLTITNSLYYDTKMKDGIFLTWVPPKHDNVQFDIGYDKKRFIIGISTAIDFRKHH